MRYSSDLGWPKSNFATYGQIIHLPLYEFAYLLIYEELGCKWNKNPPSDKLCVSVFILRIFIDQSEFSTWSTDRPRHDPRGGQNKLVSEVTMSRAQLALAARIKMLSEART